MAKVEKWNGSPKCSFCGKSADRVAKVVAGPNAYICNECIDLCNDIMGAGAEAEVPESQGVHAPAARLVLASSSVARLRVLRDAGLAPVVEVSGVSEEFGDLTPTQAVVSLAERKAQAVAPRCPDSLVIGCDSMLELDGVALGKPASRAEAEDTWRRMSGRQATLHTGHCLIDTARGRRTSRLVSSVVEFEAPSERELALYVATPEPQTLAGGFSIDGLAGPFVRAIHGSPSNVLGLSLPDLRDMLAELGTQIVDLWRTERT